MLDAGLRDADRQLSRHVRSASSGAAVSGWVLRITSDVCDSWWCGPGTLSSPLLCDALVFETPADVRDAMRAVGLRVLDDGLITPMRLAVARAPRSQLSLFAM